MPIALNNAISTARAFPNPSKVGQIEVGTERPLPKIRDIQEKINTPNIPCRMFGVKKGGI
jgi:hypothetical protein